VVERVGAWLGEARHWAVIGGVALVLMLGLPVAGAYAQREVLRSKVASLEKRLGMDADSREETDRRLALYSELNETRWPMTKLVAEFGGAAPVGIELDSLDLRTGERVTARGTAEEFSAVLEMQSALEESGVFEDVQIVRAQEVDDRLEFEMTARAMQVRVFEAARGIEDFAERTLAQRLYGDRAELAGTGPRESGSGGGGSRSRGERRAERDSGDGDDDGADRVFDERAEAMLTSPIPEPLDEGVIAEMDRATVLEEFPPRRAAAARTDIDSETRSRLEREVDLLRERLRSLRGGSA